VLQIGSEPVSGFQLLSRLGVGTHSEVWEARSADGHIVALKFIDSRQRPAPHLRAEVRILRTLTEEGHANLIRLLGVYASAHFLVLCLEKADGNLEDLRRKYRETSGRNVAPDHLLDLLGQAARGLDWLARIKPPCSDPTSPGLQHGNVNPGNLLVVGDAVKITGFSLCAALSQQMHKSDWRATPPYAAPELTYGRASASADQYSLAVTYCDLVAGNRIVASPATDTVCGSAEINLSKVRGRERPVLERALATDPSRRWPDCEAFIDALREVALPFRPNAKLSIRPGRPVLTRPS
jgi:serine/threonine protein kinase